MSAGWPTLDLCGSYVPFPDFCSPSLLVYVHALAPAWSRLTGETVAAAATWRQYCQGIAPPRLAAAFPTGVLICKLSPNLLEPSLVPNSSFWID